MTQYYPNSTGYVMHAYRKDTIFLIFRPNVINLKAR